MKKNQFILKLQNGTLIIGEHEVDLNSLQQAITTLVNLSQEVPGEMLKWDPQTLGQMSIPGMKDLQEVRSLMAAVNTLRRSENFHTIADENAELNQNVES